MGVLWVALMTVASACFHRATRHYRIAPV
jgi:hypothetical protein